MVPDCRGSILSQPPRRSPTDPAAEVATVGLTLTPVPAVLYEQVQALHQQRGLGIVVDQITPKSAAAVAGLRRFDILLSYQKTPVRDVAHFAKLLRAVPPDHKMPLVVLRGGKETVLQVGLSTKLLTNADLAEPPKGLIKPGGPPAVHVVAEPLQGAKMRITFTFYSEGQGKLDRLTCSGSLDEIQGQVQMASDQKKMSANVRISWTLP